MALNVNDLRNGAVFKADGELWMVLTYELIKMGRGSGTVKVKVRNLRTGSTTEKSFITGAKVEEADVEKKKVQYLYRDGDVYNFMDPVSFEQFSVDGAILGDQAKFLMENLDVILLVGEGQVLSLELPLSLTYTIAETGPEEKGNTVSNVYKEAVMDNGMMVRVPMFGKVGDKIKVDTRSGQYVERVK